MVSPLSSRILNLEAKANMVKYPLHHRPLQSVRSRKRESGYAADKESHQATNVNVSVDKQRRATHVELQAKKRRIEESNYQATVARQDLQKAQIPYEAITADKSSVLPVGSVDMSRVSLIISSRSSPYDVEKIPSKDVGLKVDPMDTCEINSLLKQTEGFYSIKGGCLTDEVMIERDVSVTSLTDRSSRTPSTQSTDTESDGDEALQVSSLPPKLFDEEFQEKEEKKREDEKDAEHVLSELIKSTAGSCTTSFEDALFSPNTARLIADQNYRILHASAAFSKFTGLPSDKIVGRSLKNVVCMTSLVKAAPKYISSSKDGVQIPVFVKGSFSDSSQKDMLCSMKSSYIHISSTGGKGETEMSAVCMDFERSVGNSIKGAEVQTFNTPLPCVG